MAFSSKNVKEVRKARIAKMNAAIKVPETISFDFNILKTAGYCLLFSSAIVMVIGIITLVQKI